MLCLILINKKISMNHNQSSNYCLVSPQNPHYLFLLKSAQLTANPLIYFDQTNPLISPDNQPELLPHTYYHIRYSPIRKKQNTVKIIQATPLARIGQQWNSQTFLKHMQNFQGTLKQPAPNNRFMREEIEHGELRVNDEGWIYVKSYKSGFRKKLKMVNSPFAIPLLKGCRVHFFLRKYAENEGPKVKISGLQFKKLSLAGVLKIINGRVFFQPRHTDYERMVPLTIPQQLLSIIYDTLPKYRGSLPYSIFKRYEDEQSINQKLAQFVLRGRFVDWPLRFSHPVIEIQSIEPMNCETLKQATLYELGIPFIKYDAEEKRLTDQIINNFHPELINDRIRVQERCYSFDCEGGSCFDDAFSFVKTEHGFRVSIHISDVPALVGDKPYLLKQARQRDQTIYIKNYYRSMFPQKLRDFMSLQEGKQRLTYSMTFQIKDDGQIVYDSIELAQSIIIVDQNITHGEVIKRKEDQTVLSGLAKTLQRCQQLESLMLFDDIETAKVTSQLLYLSSYLPIVTFYNNQQKLSTFIHLVDNYFHQMSLKAKKIIQDAAKLSKNQKQKQEQIKQNLSHDTSTVNNHQIMESSQKNQQTFQTNSSQITKPIDKKDQVSGKSQNSESSNEQNGDLIQNQIEQSPEHDKKSSLSPNMRVINIQKNEFLRKVTPKEGSAAQCFRFLDKLFRAAQMSVDFTHPKNIQNAFKYCQKKYNDPIARTYFRTKLIMSKQHFEVISKLAKAGQLRQFQIGNSCFQYPGTPQKSKEQEKVQQKIQSTPFSLQAKTQSIQKQQIIQNQQINQQSQIYKKEIIQAEKEQKSTNIQEINLEKDLQPKAQITKEQQQKQNEISFIYNILTLLTKYPFNLQDYSPKSQTIQLLNQLKHHAQQLGIQILLKQADTILTQLDNNILKSYNQTHLIDKLSSSSLIKWNTPIRSGTSFEALDLIQKHNWIFSGKLKPSTAISHRKQSGIIQSLIKTILQKRSRQESLELSGRMKQACRELAKIDFLFMVRQQPDKIWEFVTITSPSQKVQFVYREFIEEVEVANPQKNVLYYSRVRGRFKGIFEFPIKLKVVLIEE